MEQRGFNLVGKVLIVKADNTNCFFQKDNNSINLFPETKVEWCSASIPDNDLREVATSNTTKEIPYAHQ